MASYLLVCPATVTILPEQTASCGVGWDVVPSAPDVIGLLQGGDFVGMYQAIGITPENILYVMTWGMGVVLSLWAVGFAIGLAVGSIRKA